MPRPLSVPYKAAPAMPLNHLHGWTPLVPPSQRSMGPKVASTAINGVSSTGRPPIFCARARRQFGGCWNPSRRYSRRRSSRRRHHRPSGAGRDRRRLYCKTPDLARRAALPFIRTSRDCPLCVARGSGSRNPRCRHVVGSLLI